MYAHKLVKFQEIYQEEEIFSHASTLTLLPHHIRDCPPLPLEGSGGLGTALHRHYAA